MRILGIETSCDETSAAVVEDGRKLLSNVVLSQEKLHAPYKGIVPELASRAHLENINWVIHKAIQGGHESWVMSRGSKIKNSQLITHNSQLPIDAIAVTLGPGLVGSLLIGKMTAEALGWCWNLPVVGVNHLEAHLFASLLEYPELEPPFLGLIVSGGHTDLVVVKKFGSYRVLGRTRDDAAGECFDKVAKILGLPYPGGPEIDKLAKKGNPNAVPFARPYLNGSWDFSFSGIKTAVLYFVNSLEFRELSLETKGSPPCKGGDTEGVNSQLISDICASFQRAVADVLVAKTLRAAKKFGLKKIVVGGGVAANSELRERFIAEQRKNRLQVFLPSKKNCTDNAAMVACAGYYKLQSQSWAMGHESWAKAQRDTTSSSSADRHDSQLTTALQVNPSLPIQNW